MPHSEQLFEILLDVARQFRTAKEVVAEHKSYILRLKSEVCKVRFGSLGVRVPVKLNTADSYLPLVRRMRWKEFCECQFGVTADWVNRLCGGKADGQAASDDEHQDSGGGPISLKLDGRQQVALLSAQMAASGYPAGGWGGKKSATAEGYTRTLRSCHRLMASTGVRVISLDWSNMDWHSLAPDDFVYFDPPYLGADVRPYGASNVNHEDLVRFLKTANFKWMLSEYPNDLYLRELGQPFFAEDVQPKTANYHQNGGKERRIECIWRNH